MVSENKSSRSAPPEGGRRGRRVLAVVCSVHALHDGFTDLLYILLPLWQAEFGLTYSGIGLLRAVYAGAMAGFQVPAGMLARRVGRPLLLAAGTALAGLGLILAGVSGGFALLVAGLVLSGLGSSTQHPIGSDVVAHAFAGARSRPALGAYNFAGDLGKMALPALTAFLLTMMVWRPTMIVLGMLGVVGAIAILVLLPKDTTEPRAQAHDPETPQPAVSVSSGAIAGGFPLLLTIGIIDSATRMGFLTFLPFLLQAAGADLPMIGVALTLVFAGGAAGKLACGFLGARLGVFRTVCLTEGATALGIVLLPSLPLWGALAVLPVIGLALNGTSSVLYGTVPELVEPERRATAFGIFYTGVIGGGAVAPVLYGLFSDLVGVPSMMALIAAIVLLTIPLAWRLQSSLKQ